MSAPESNGVDRSWLLNDWDPDRGVSFDLKKTDFGMEWSADQSSGTIEFRLVAEPGGRITSFQLGTDGKYKGSLEVDRREYPFTFIITINGTTERVMCGSFFDRKHGGPDPVATWGAEERGGSEGGEARAEPALSLETAAVPTSAALPS
jgi:hypothetical protein